MSSRVVSFLRSALVLAWRFWPLGAFYPAWGFAHDHWQVHLMTFPANQGGSWTASYGSALWAWPAIALLGPLAVMAVAIFLYRDEVSDRVTAMVGILGLVVCSLITGRSEFLRLWPYIGDPGFQLSDVMKAFNPSLGFAVIAGLVAAFVGTCVAAGPWPVGRRSSATLQRSTSDVHGHAAWLSMKEAKGLFSGPDPAHGGIVVGEAYRVDEDAVAKRARFNPRDRRTWGRGGRAPLLIDPCHTGSTHALVFAGPGGFKTTSVGIPTLLTWTGAAVVLDPSSEIGPMVAEHRRQALGHRVVMLDPATAKESGVNVLDWIDVANPLAGSQVDAVVNWITTERRDAAAGNDFFPGSARDLISCLLADLLWNPAVPQERKTLRALQRRLVTPEKQMRDLLVTIHQESASAKARDLAGTLMEQHEETFSGVYSQANRDTRWLSDPAYADLVSGGAEGSPLAMRTSDLAGGKITVFLQLPLSVLMTTPALGRVLVGALLNAAYQADGAVTGRILFLLDEVARLGYMHLIEIARDAGRKYGITLLLLYQSLGQLVSQWGREGKQAWFDSTTWQLFAAVQDWDTARDLSAMCGEYGVIATSTGDTEGSQSRGGKGGSSSSGRSENRSEVRRALTKPDELRNDTRADEAFVLVGGSKPLRCGRAIWFRRPEWVGLIKASRFYRGRDAGK